MSINLTDLNGHLFAQLERLSDKSQDQHELALEIDRTKAITQISEQIIKSSELKLQAAKLVANNGGANYKDLLPEHVKPFTGQLVSKVNNQTHTKEPKKVPDYAQGKMVQS